MLLIDWEEIDIRQRVPATGLCRKCGKTSLFSAVIIVQKDSSFKFTDGMVPSRPKKAVLNKEWRCACGERCFSREYWKS